MTTTAIALTASIAAAQSVSDQLISQLQDQGFTRIEIKQGPSQVKVEAIRGNTEVEFVYDSTTGALLSRDVGTVDPGDDTRPGVEIKREDENFVGSDDRNDRIRSFDSRNDGINNDRYDDNGGDDDRYDDDDSNDRYDDSDDRYDDNGSDDDDDSNDRSDDNDDDDDNDRRDGRDGRDDN
jgi:hypothetical protein